MDERSEFAALLLTNPNALVSVVPESPDELHAYILDYFEGNAVEPLLWALDAVPESRFEQLAERIAHAAIQRPSEGA